MATAKLLPPSKKEAHGQETQRFYIPPDCREGVEVYSTVTFLACEWLDERSAELRKEGKIEVERSIDCNDHYLATAEIKWQLAENS